MKHEEIIRTRDVMRTNIVLIDGIATVADALRAFKANEIELLVIKKRDEHDAYGVVLLTDIVKKVLAKDRAIDRVNLYEIMSKPVISVEPDMNVRYCSRLFNHFGLSHTLVIESGKVLGVIGYKELLAPLFESVD